MGHSKYINSTNAAGIHITEASPIDDRYFINTEAEIAVLSNVEPLPSIMYDGMLVQFADTRRKFMWLESDYGLMTEGYTYPEWYDDIQGQDYANKLYNFVLADSVNKVTVVYSDNADAGLLVPVEELPYSVARDFDSAIISFRSDDTGYTEIEYPDRIEETSGGIMIILDPKPSIGETFKITIQ